MTISKQKVRRREKNSIAIRIRQARESAHLSQKELALSTGVTDKSISSYEQGRSLPPIDKLKKIAKKTQRPLLYFTDDETISMDIVSKLNIIEKEFQEVRKLLEKQK